MGLDFVMMRIMVINLCKSWESLCLVCAVIQTCHNISATHYTLHIIHLDDAYNFKEIKVSRTNISKSLSHICDFLCQSNMNKNTEYKSMISVFFFCFYTE